MANTIRLNKLLRALDISLSKFEDVMNIHSLNPADKIVILDNNSMVIDKSLVATDDSTIEELITIKNSIHRIIMDKMEDLNNKINNPEL